SNEPLVRTIQRSWYSVRTSTLMTPNPVSLPRTYYQSLLRQGSDQDENDDGKKMKTENDDENDDVEGKKMKTRKIRMYPTLEEKEKLRKWIGTVRWTYNKVL
ncbi:hypothetical protein C2G38_2115293, partial [Gigaspora rosea]